MEEVQIGLSPISCFLYEEEFVDIDRLLASWTVLLNIGCILGHIWPVVVLLLQAPIKAYSLLAKVKP